MAWLSSMISSSVPTDIGVPRRSSTFDLSSFRRTRRIKAAAKARRRQPGGAEAAADLLFLLQGLHLLLVPDELLLHQQVIFDPLLLQQLEAALSVRGD